MNNNLPLKELSINEIFNGSDNVTYEIPIYQRNYAWEKDEIATLVRDVWDACKKTKAVYYIGTLVTYDNDNTIFEVIDGQQRLTTLFLILRALNKEVRNKLTYHARKNSNETIKNIPDFNNSYIDNGIKDGYTNATQAIKEIVEDGEKEQFANYLLNSVHIIHYRVPKDVDLNHYFEVMNSRGEQLEKHEIVKAKLMNVLANENDKAKFATIWDACSEMGVYIQTKETMKAFFVNNLKDFGYYDGTFDNLPDVNVSESNTPTLESLINSTENQTGKRPDEDDDSKNSMFQPIIDFPNFLLIVLKITRLGDAGFTSNNFILDDKELINEFNNILENNKIQENEKSRFAKHFCFNLLQAKYLLDNFVVHHTNDEDTYGHNPWQLQRWTKEEKGCTKNLYEKEGNEDKNLIQAKMVQLLSMFEVSFTARQRKNYLFYVLYHLFENRDIKTYCEFLENLTRKYFFDIYMDGGRLNEINTPKPGSFDEAIIIDGRIDVNIRNLNVTLDSFNIIFGDGSDKTKGIPLFVFNYMDYQIWKKYAANVAGEKLKEQSEDRKEFFRQLGCKDFGLDVFKQFYFSRTRRSLEHYYPQALVRKNPNGITDNQINCFGNFAMIGSDANSSGSDWTPKIKLDHYLDLSKKIRQVGVASLKFRIMMQICNDNAEAKSRETGQEWTFEDIKNHQDLMLNILLEQ
mgnify:CR=1 FL=1